MEAISETGSWLPVKAGRIHVQKKNTWEGKLLNKPLATNCKLLWGAVVNSLVIYKDCLGITAWEGEPGGQKWDRPRPGLSLGDVALRINLQVPFKLITMKIMQTTTRRKPGPKPGWTVLGMSLGSQPWWQWQAGQEEELQRKHKSIRWPQTG